MFCSLSAPGSARLVVQATAEQPLELPHQHQQQPPVPLAASPINISFQSSRRRAISSSIIIPASDVRKLVREYSSSPPIGQPTQQRSRNSNFDIDSSDDEAENAEDQKLLETTLKVESDTENASNYDHCTPQSDVEDDDDYNVCTKSGMS
ncbi:hypothetical protein BC830DRAFT_936008 [Chytriomyces sp. MP71]|nr:hypothetical protein BC830DRAFT_936008 [Chytriomyces sp. MP71]